MSTLLLLHMLFIMLIHFLNVLNSISDMILMCYILSLLNNVCSCC